MGLFNDLFSPKFPPRGKYTTRIVARPGEPQVLIPTPPPQKDGSSLPEQVLLAPQDAFHGMVDFPDPARPRQNPRLKTSLVPCPHFRCTGAFPQTASFCPRCGRVVRLINHHR